MNPRGPHGPQALKACAFVRSATPADIDFGRASLKRVPWGAFTYVGEGKLLGVYVP